MDVSADLETTPVLDVLENQSFQHVATALRNQSERILMRWEALVRELLPTADRLTFAQLRDHIPGTLVRMADALESTSPVETRSLISQTTDHGVLRFHQGYNVEELIIEYRLLRRVIIEEVESCLGRRTSMDEDIALSMGIDTVLQQGVVALVAHQRQKLQAASQAEAKYISFLSHDLRNNLNSVTMLLEVLQMELAGKPEFKDPLADVAAAQSAIMSTIEGMNRILHAQRLQSGNVEAKIAPVDLHGLAMEIVREASRAADKKGITLAVEIPPSLTFATDREWMKLVLQNLVGNAVKYSTKGTIRLTCEIRDEEGGKHRVVSVSDEGPGIAPNQQKVIFEAFQRGDTHGQGGMGLGLAIASQAARLLGGQLRVSSQLGAGSTFSLALPV
jgi:signal transduction histidine kinase